jgi:hypothetical protein
MPPQQRERLLDLIDEALGFCAHVQLLRRLRRRDQIARGFNGAGSPAQLLPEPA